MCTCRATPIHIAVDRTLGVRVVVSHALTMLLHYCIRLQTDLDGGWKNKPQEARLSFSVQLIHKLACCHGTLFVSFISICQ